MKKPLTKVKLRALMKQLAVIIIKMTFQQSKIFLETVTKTKKELIHLSTLTITITTYFIYTYNS